MDSIDLTEPNLTLVLAWYWKSTFVKLLLLLTIVIVIVIIKKFELINAIVKTNKKLIKNIAVVIIKNLLKIFFLLLLSC